MAQSQVGRWSCPVPTFAGCVTMPRRKRSDAEPDGTPMKVKKEQGAERPPQGSPPSLPHQGSPQGQGYVNTVLLKVDEINGEGLNIFEWLEVQIRDWPEGPTGWAASLDKAFPPDNKLQYCLEATLMDPECKNSVVHARLAQLALHPQS
eukprot:4765038-Heterocapsa_arctica.AAC.1